MKQNLKTKSPKFKPLVPRRQFAILKKSRPTSSVGADGFLLACDDSDLFVNRFSFATRPFTASASSDPDVRGAFFSHDSTLSASLSSLSASLSSSSAALLRFIIGVDESGRPVATLDTSGSFSWILAGLSALSVVETPVGVPLSLGYMFGMFPRGMAPDSWPPSPFSVVSCGNLVEVFAPEDVLDGLLGIAPNDPSET